MLTAMFSIILIFVSLMSANVLQIIPAFEATYPAGKIGGSSATGLPAQFVSIPPAKEYYLDYQVMFESDWDWVRGGKLPGLVGGSHTSGCATIVPDGWSARFMWRGGGAGEVYLYNQDRKNHCGDDYGFSSPGNFVKGVWNRITERVVINSPGNKDGLIEAWYNGRKAVTLNNVQLRGKVAETTALVDAVSLQTFYGGSTDAWAPSHATHAQFSEFHVSDDLPDLSKPFETGVGIRTPSSGKSGASNPGARFIADLGNLGNVNVTHGAERKEAGVAPIEGEAASPTLRCATVQGRMLRAAEGEAATTRASGALIVWSAGR